MPAVVGTDAGAQFVDATSADGETVLVQEVDSIAFGRLGWTVLNIGRGERA